MTVHIWQQELGGQVLLLEHKDCRDDPLVRYVEIEDEGTFMSARPEATAWRAVCAV